MWYKRGRSRSISHADGGSLQVVDATGTFVSVADRKCRRATIINSGERRSAFSPLASPIEEAANFEYEQNNSQGRGTHRAANRSVPLLANFAGGGPSLSCVGCQRSGLCIRCRF